MGLSESALQRVTLLGVERAFLICYVEGLV
jgi:hypothetical protein